MKKGPSKPRPWTPFEPATLRFAGQPVEMAEGTTAWINSHYVVHRKNLDSGWTHLSIRSVSRSAARDWRHFQRIKNELTDPEREAVELFPAESRLTDTANQYHLWVAPPGVKLPLGWDHGRVLLDEEETPGDELIAEAAKMLGVDPQIAVEGLAKAKQRKL